MVETVQKQKETTSQWWWFDRLSDSNQNQKRSSWLQFTLSELDENTGAMLKLIEEDADSFAQRAEMYYKKRPQLISMVEEFYRTYRSLAERYDQFKSESGTPHRAWVSPLSINNKYRQEKLASHLSMDKVSLYDSYSEMSYETEDYESDVEDPPELEEEGEELQRVCEETEQKEVAFLSDNNDGNNDHMMKLMEEIERLKEENRAQKEELIQKDEEKRDAIRQLSLAMDYLREENEDLKKRVVAKGSPPPKKKQNHLLLLLFKSS